MKETMIRGGRWMFVLFAFMIFFSIYVQKQQETQAVGAQPDAGAENVQPDSQDAAAQSDIEEDSMPQ